MTLLVINDPLLMIVLLTLKEKNIFVYFGNLMCPSPVP